MEEKFEKEILFLCVRIGKSLCFMLEHINEINLFLCNKFNTPH